MKKTYNLQPTIYQLIGRVIKGDGYGKKLGYPTANIDRRQYVRNKIKVRLGIWSAVVQATGLPERKAALVIGPIDKKGLPKIEAHIIGFKGNLYGKKLEIVLGKFIRPFKKFKSEDELKKQIEKDIKLIS